MDMGPSVRDISLFCIIPRNLFPIHETDDSHSGTLCGSSGVNVPFLVPRTRPSSVYNTRRHIVEKIEKTYPGRENNPVLYSLSTCTQPTSSNRACTDFTLWRAFSDDPRSRASEPKLRQEKTRITLFDPPARGGRGAHDLRSPVEGAHPVVVRDADVCPEFLNHHTHRVRVVIGARGV
jgi:hypothetical protein